MTFDLAKYKQIALALWDTAQVTWKPLFAIFIVGFTLCSVLGVFMPVLHTFSFGLGGGVVASVAGLLFFHYVLKK